MAQLISGATREPELVTKIDEIGQTTYIGTAKLGVADSAAKWQIRRINRVGTATDIQYADGNRRFDNIWENRTILTYSN